MKLVYLCMSPDGEIFEGDIQTMIANVRSDRPEMTTDHEANVLLRDHTDGDNPFVYRDGTKMWTEIHGEY